MSKETERLSTKEFLIRFKDELEKISLPESSKKMCMDFVNGMSMEEIQTKYNQRKQTVYHMLRGCAEKLYRDIPEGYLWDPAKGEQYNQDIN